MCRLIESIKIENRQLVNIEWHNTRFNETRKDLFSVHSDINLREAIDIPSNLSTNTYKCRVLYKETIKAIEFHPYTIKPVKTLKLVIDDTIEYAYKYEHREAFANLMKQKGSADDILIVKNGCVTDTSFSNIAFFDGKQWYTPETYLLNGTQRQRLLAKGAIKEKRITIADLQNFKETKLINAMLDFESTRRVKII